MDGGWGGGYGVLAKGFPLLTDLTYKAIKARGGSGLGVTMVCTHVDIRHPRKIWPSPAPQEVPMVETANWVYFIICPQLT